MPLDVTPLRSLVRGEVLTQVDAGFAAAHAGFNLAEEHHPDVVVQAGRTPDIAAAVRFASENALPVRVQATGHGKGRGMDGGLLLVTDRLRGVDVDPRRGTARVDAGVRWDEVLPLAGSHGLTGLCGSTPHVGVVGYTLGGGMGPMGRSYGFNSDLVRYLEMVDATGRTIEVDAQQEPELFWALRGGKPDVGIVTAMEFDLIEVPTYFGGGIFYSAEHAAHVLHAFADWAPSLPEAAGTSIALLRAPDMPGVPEFLRDRLTVHLRYVYVGDPARGEELLAPMRALAAPLVDLIGVNETANIGSVHQDPSDPMPARDEGMTLRELPHAAIDALLAAAGPDTDVPLIAAEIRLMGGALGREQGGESAVGGRDAAFNAFVIGPYPPPLRDAVDASSADVFSGLSPWGTGGTLINFQGSGTALGQRRVAWTETTRRRLDAVKSQWDPGEAFHFAYAAD